ncbi:MAG: prepilin peptidase [Candidatus Omnitrophica bacterium]|nr:prepilin peptidase [Candidatus Omnitrophota bacterium]
MLDKVVVFIFGSIVGSFLNVCIHRLPLSESIVRPRSYCPHCKRLILWYDNVPLLSYIILRARCRFCKQKISFRYFLVELLSAFIFLLFYLRVGLGFNFFFYILFTCGLIIATFVDIQHRIIPDEISLGGIVVGFHLNLFRSLLFSKQHNLGPWFDSLLGILVGGGIIYLTGLIFDVIYFRLLKRPPIQGQTSSMGGGDVKLLAMVGAFLGWRYALLTFFLAPFLGVLFGTMNLLIKKDHTLPYGPFLSLAAFLSIFWFDRIIGFLFVI